MERLSDLIHLENNNSLEEYSRKLYNEFISDKELLEEVKESGFTLDDIYKNIGSFHELKENRDKEKMIDELKREHDVRIRTGKDIGFTMKANGKKA